MSNEARKNNTFLGGSYDSLCKSNLTSAWHKRQNGFVDRLYTKAYCVPLPCTAVPVLSLVVGYVLHAETKL